MKLCDLSPAKGSRKNRKRLGRGVGTGQGRTGGRGDKGQNSRSGGGVRAGYEGGQMPIHRRLPKRGFTNIFKKTFQLVNLDDLEARMEAGKVDSESLQAAGLVKYADRPVKLLGRGSVSKKFEIEVAKASKSAVAAIEALAAALRSWGELGFDETLSVYAFSILVGTVTPGRVYHTLGWPLPAKTFGGGFIYGMKDDIWDVGFVTGLGMKRLNEIKGHEYINVFMPTSPVSSCATAAKTMVSPSFSKSTLLPSSTISTDTSPSNAAHFISASAPLREVITASVSSPLPPAPVSAARAVSTSSLYRRARSSSW